MSMHNTDKPHISGESGSSEDIYQRLIQSVNASIVVVDLDGAFHFANAIAARAMNCTVEELVGKKMWELFPPDMAERQMDRVRSVIEDGQEYFEEWRTMTGGEWRWYDMVLQPFRNSPGHPDMCMVIAHDITARKRSEQLQLVLYRIANAAYTTKDLHELYQSIRDELNQVIDTGNFCIALYNNETHCISLTYNVDEKDKFDHFPAGKTLMSYVIRTDRPLLANRKVKRDLIERGEVEPIGSPAAVWVGVPLRVGGLVIGAVSVQHYSNETAYTENDLEILEFASNQIAAAIERKQAEEDLQEAYEELEARVQARTAELESTNRRLRDEIENRRQVEEALRESERRYALATTAGRVGVWDWNMITNEIYVDPRLKAILGYEDREIPNHLDHWGKLVHQEDAARMEKVITDHVEGRTPQFDFEHRMIHKDGTVRWILARGNVMRDEAGHAHRMIGTDTDITELKNAQAALSESEERFRKLSDAAEEGIVIHDRGFIVDANEALARMFGYELSEIIGMNAENLATPESVRRIIENTAADYDKPYEVTGIRKDGSTFIIQVTGKTCMYKGKQLRVGAVHDITDLKRAEEMLQKTADELRAERKILAEKNTALKQILQHIENERRDYQQRICQDIQQAIAPHMAKLKKEAGSGQASRFEELELNLNTLLSKDIDAFRSRYARLSPRELEICDMIRDGKSSKQISEILSLSLVTVHKHREQIRRKLGLTNKKVNLTTYLQAH